MDPVTALGIGHASVSLLSALVPAVQQLTLLWENLKAVDENTQEYEHDLQAFEFALIILDGQLNSGQIKDCWNNEGLDRMLLNATRTVSKIQSILLEVRKKRNVMQNVRMFYKSSKYEQEIRHLFLRLRSYTSTLSLPALLSAITRSQSSAFSPTASLTVFENRVKAIEESLRAIAVDLRNYREDEPSQTGSSNNKEFIKDSNELIAIANGLVTEATVMGSSITKGTQSETSETTLQTGSIEQNISSMSVTGIPLGPRRAQIEEWASNVSREPSKTAESSQPKTSPHRRPLFSLFGTRRVQADASDSYLSQQPSNVGASNTAQQPIVGGNTPQRPSIAEPPVALTQSSYIRSLLLRKRYQVLEEALEANDLDKAIELLANAKKENPQGSLYDGGPKILDLRYKIIQKFLESKKYDQAIPLLIEYEDEISKAPDDSSPSKASDLIEIKYQLGLAYLESIPANIASGLSIFQPLSKHVNRNHPRYASILYNLAWALQSRDATGYSISEAKDCCEAAIEICDSQHEVHSDLKADTIRLMISLCKRLKNSDEQLWASILKEHGDNTPLSALWAGSKPKLSLHHYVPGPFAPDDENSYNVMKLSPTATFVVLGHRTNQLSHFTILDLTVSRIRVAGTISIRAPMGWLSPPELAISTSDTLAMCFDDNYHIQIIDLHSGQRLGILSNGTAAGSSGEDGNRPENISFSSGDKYLMASLRKTGDVLIWDVSSWELKWVVPRTVGPSPSFICPIFAIGLTSANTKDTLYVVDTNKDDGWSTTIYGVTLGSSGFHRSKQDDCSQSTKLFTTGNGLIRLSPYNGGISISTSILTHDEPRMSWKEISSESSIDAAISISAGLLAVWKKEGQDIKVVSFNGNVQTWIYEKPLSCAFAPNEKCLAVCKDDGSISFHALTSRGQRGKIRPGIGLRF